MQTVCMWKMVLTSSLEIFVMPTSRFAAFCYFHAMLPDAASSSWGCFPQAAEEEDFHDLVARLTAQYDQQQAHCTELEDENAVLRQALSAASTTGPTGPDGRCGKLWIGYNADLQTLHREAPGRFQPCHAPHVFGSMWVGRGWS